MTVKITSLKSCRQQQSRISVIFTRCCQPCHFSNRKNYSWLFFLIHDNSTKLLKLQKWCRIGIENVSMTTPSVETSYLDQTFNKCQFVTYLVVRTVLLTPELEQIKWDSLGAYWEKLHYTKITYQQPISSFAQKEREGKNLSSPERFHGQNSRQNCIYAVCCWAARPESI